MSHPTTGERKIYMRCAVLTAVRNGIVEAPEYVRWHSQECFRDIDFYIWDGQSTDGSLGVLRGFQRAHVQSGADSGIFDAWNKLLDTVAEAKYDYLCFLGIDDLLGTSIPQALEEVSSEAREPADLLYGNVVRVRGKRWRLDPKPILKNLSLAELDTHGPAHPGLWHRGALFENGRRFDASLRVVADYKFILDAARRLDGVKLRHLGCVQAVLGTDGVSYRALSRVRDELAAVGREHAIPRAVRSAGRRARLLALLGETGFETLRRLAWWLRGSEISLPDPSRPNVVVHAVPAAGRGGAEVALTRAAHSLSSQMAWRVALTGLGRDRFGLARHRLSLWRLMKELTFARHTITVVTSIWKSYWVGWVARATGNEWVVFRHSQGYGHIIERWVTAAALRRCSRIFCDSEATRRALPALRLESAVVIPHFFKGDHSAASREGHNARMFIYVGRAKPVKRLDLVATLVRQLIAAGCADSVQFVGEGTTSSKELCGLKESFPEIVRIRGALPHADVLKLLQEAGFTIMLSDREGFSMATFEAMLSGCIPIIRRVGEVPHYCDRSNAVIVDVGAPGWARSTTEIIVTLQDNVGQQADIRGRAMRVCERYPKDYVDSYAAALGVPHHFRYPTS